MPAYFENYIKEFTPVEVTVTADWTDDSHTQIEAVATATWAEAPMDSETEYRFEFILVGDDLYGDTAEWTQSNYYAGGTYGYLEYMEQFCETDDAYITGLHYNDVGLISSGIGGIPGSIESISLDAPNTCSFIIIPSEAINAYGNTIAFHDNKLRVVAAVLESNGGSGKILNAARVDVPDPSGVEKVITKENRLMAYSIPGKVIILGDEAADVYTVSGMHVFRGTGEVNVPAGLYIVRKNHSTVKLMVE